ncbi:MAG: DUF262 domain-containing protein [Chloroflexota bacterium]|nr:DUF262 domain-containing protein [Chloroflexota bacterium]MDE2941286.1 DUF262 domain-containing protein [Chloroflexota bacterium]MDE3267781.1 DUF262 domain-containing protein [Chloroflexota bacterium]
MVSLEANEGDKISAIEADVEVEDQDVDSVAPVRYEITSFGVDFDVEGLFRRLERGEIAIPKFQRNFVWSLRHSSRFIESLLLGLPVPGIFLSRDFDSDKYVVIDGQQRLKSLQFFCNGVFNPSAEANTQRTFKLTGVQQEFEGLTYQELSPRDRFRIDNSVIHATVVKQDAPAEDNTSVYHVFDRINSTGLRLSAQEIRSAICHGKFIDKLGILNEHPSWRSMFGRVHSRMRDQELILRFLAFFFDEALYNPPMSEFLTVFVQKNRNPQDDFLTESNDIFTQTMDAFMGALGERAFRIERALNAAIFDSMSVGLARRIASSNNLPEPEPIKAAHRSLIEDRDYLEAVSRSTADERSVSIRMTKAVERFAVL